MLSTPETVLHIVLPDFTRQMSEESENEDQSSDVREETGRTRHGEEGGPSNVGGDQE